jgi:hypothetical protein
MEKLVGVEVMEECSKLELLRSLFGIQPDPREAVHAKSAAALLSPFEGRKQRARLRQLALRIRAGREVGTVAVRGFFIGSS